MTTETIEAPVRERTPRDVLLAAARYIEEHGWTQGSYFRGNRACVMGAIYRADGADPGLSPSAAASRALSVLGLVTDFDTSGWNDAPERTEAEVIAALRAAAESAR